MIYLQHTVLTKEELFKVDVTLATETQGQNPFDFVWNTTAVANKNNYLLPQGFSSYCHFQ